MKMKKLVATGLAVATVICSSAVAFAGIDYSQWSSQSAYPSDVVGTQLFTPVKALMDRKIITGDSDGLFHADKNISRAEFATMMAKATNNISNLAIVEKQNKFNDLNGYTWAKGYINACADAKLIEGIGNSNYAPGNNVTYIQAMAVIIRTKNGSAATVSSLGTWPNNYITYANMYNMMGDVVVHDWNAPASKGDIAKLVYRNMPKDSSASANIKLSPTKSNPTAGESVTVTANATSTSGTVTYAWWIDNVLQSATGTFITFNASGSKQTVKVTVTCEETGKTATTSTATIDIN